MKKKHPEHVNLERWLVSYADFITLLFAFFVIMYAISQADMAKFKQVSSSIRSAFSTGSAGMMDVGGHSGGDTLNQFDQIESSGGRLHDLPAGKINTAADPDAQLQELKELLEETMSLELGATEITDQLKMEYDSQGLLLRIAAKDFFESGQVEPHADLLPALDRIGRVLMKTQKNIRIEGHIDEFEKSTPGYHSGWSLSTRRAEWLAEYWFSRFNLDPARVSVAGVSYFHPLSKGKTPLDRAKNRRVEIIILNNQFHSKDNPPDEKSPEGSK